MMQVLMAVGFILAILLVLSLIYENMKRR